jgi:hypothetical protein
MQLLILRVIEGSARHQAHKYNLLGRGELQGDLERSLGVRFERESRRVADRAFEALKASGLIVSTHEDLVDPESWVELTAAGREALNRGEVDPIDTALAKLSPHLVELREGAHIVLSSTAPDSARQAAHSGRELIDQLLRLAAPDDEVRRMPWFKPDATAATGITRRQRVRLILEHTHGSALEAETENVDAMVQLIVAYDRMLMARAHETKSPDTERVRSLIGQLDGALHTLLIAEHS